MKDDLGLTNACCCKKHCSEIYKKCAPGIWINIFLFKDYSTLKGLLPVTVKEFIEGEFVKYINNNGAISSPVLEEEKSIYAKAETLVHYSYKLSEGKFMLLDIQGSSFNLYDPEIATFELQDESENKEIYFCPGNLSSFAMNKFTENHNCSTWCALMGLENIKIGGE